MSNTLECGCIVTQSMNTRCKKCKSASSAKYQRERNAYWKMIDSIIDDPVGKGDSNFEPMTDGNLRAGRPYINE